ncbi:MAG: anti-sigma factor [Hyphomicrobiaceae bacterium]
MRCSEPRELVGAYFDGELTDDERASMAEHLRTCPVCAAALARLRDVRKALSVEADRRAPPSLADRIRADIASEAAKVRPEPSRTVAPQSRWPRRAASLAAAALAGAALAWGVLTRQATQGSLAHDVVTAHLRSLAQESAVQVASSDRHTVKPWFSGRVGFSPDVKDLGSQGFPLVGGRLDYLGDQRVAVVVYRRRQHVINVFMWPAEADAARPPGGAVARSEKGYNSQRWTAGGLELWAISDLNAAELAQFQKLF